MPAKASGRSSLLANHVGVLRSLVSAYSQKDSERNDAAIFRLEPCAPMRTFGIAYVRNRRAAKLRRSGMPERAHPLGALRTIGAK
jgi:hypothetical protein